MTQQNKQPETPKRRTDAFMQNEVLSRQATFQKLLPPGVRAAWFVAEVRVAVARAPKLLECDSVSVIDALTTCAQLGLSPSGRLGSAYLIPYKTKCTLVLGYRGMIDLAYRSGEVVGMSAQVVHANEPFEVTEGFDVVIHKHDRDVDDPGALRAVYASATLRGGYSVKVLMWAREVLAIKSKSPGASLSDSPWKTAEPEMWKKTALRRLMKMLPLSPQKAQGLTRAMEVEDADWEDSAALDLTPAEPPASNNTERLKKRLQDGKQRQPEPAPHQEEPPETERLPTGNYEPGSEG